MIMSPQNSGRSYDVIVVGSGNAGMSAAHAAREAGARVAVVEKAPRAWAGGNSHFIAGLLVAHDGIDDLQAIVEAGDEEVARIVVEPYPKARYLADLMAKSGGRADPRLATMLVEESLDALRWLKGKGLRFRLNYDRMAHPVDGKQVFWGGAIVGPRDGGKGLMAEHFAAAERSGIEMIFDAGVEDLVIRDGRVCGVVVRRNGTAVTIAAGRVVLAAGGFEANPRMRAAYLGPGWDQVKVRGTPYNTGECLEMAIAGGAASAGNWSGCHATAWDLAAPDLGDRELTNRYSKNFYPYGIVVNLDGQRFFDEGAALRTHTYVAMGKAIRAQPHATAFQIFDGRTIPMLNPKEYGPPATYVEADSIEGLAAKLGIVPEALRATVDGYNAAVREGGFNPSALDDCRTEGLAPAKSHWARRIDTAPYRAYTVTCGITFTFGGLAVDGDMAVLRQSDGAPIPGLHAAGEIVGGLYHGDYVGGAGITFGTVSGRRAGFAAAAGRQPARDAA